MPIVRFSVLTAIGSLPWIVGITLAGQAVGSDWTSIRSAFEYIDYLIVAAIVTGGAYVLWRRRATRGTDVAPASETAGEDVEVVPDEQLDALR